jgi:ATP-dependent helicase/nuclease subunit A
MKNWTFEQTQAVNSRKDFNIISASAGSGKTAVIVERVIDLICDNYCNIENLLIVSFTVSAAEEIKSRIVYRLDKKF